MVFVDGENFSKRAADVAGSQLVPGPCYLKDVFVWMPNVPPRRKFLTVRGALDLDDRAIRAHYFTAVQGDDLAVNAARDKIRNCAFEPHVYKKRDGKSKQVDVALAVQMVLDASRDTFDVAVLFAGDEDYVPAVEATKDLGKSVYLVFFDAVNGGLAPELRRASDVFFNITPLFRKRWQSDPTTTTTIHYLSTGASGITKLTT